jgi:SMI1-KNR4 cell-wall
MINNRCLATQIRELLQRWDGVPPVVFGPVSDAQISYAERELGVTLPPSFRTFLRHFGGGFVFDFDILGLVAEPGHWLDIVQMNRLAPRHIPRHCVLFLYAGRDRAYYLDTSRRDLQDECPVVLFASGEEGVVVADSFLDFLRQSKRSPA